MELTSGALINSPSFGIFLFIRLGLFLYKCQRCWVYCRSAYAYDFSNSHVFGTSASQRAYHMCVGIICLLILIARVQQRIFSSLRAARTADCLRANSPFIVVQPLTGFMYAC